MKMIVVSEDQWNLEWEKMLLELERAMREQPQPDPFRTVNFHLIGLKQRLEK